MFYDGVLDNLDGMKFVSPSECCLCSRVHDWSDSTFHGLLTGHRGVRSARLQGRGLVPLHGAFHGMRVAATAIERESLMCTVWV